MVLVWMQDEATILLRRAETCRRLAARIGDPDMAARMNRAAQQYEAEAKAKAARDQEAK
jgi:hypothetical protein